MCTAKTLSAPLFVGVKLHMPPSRFVAPPPPVFFYQSLIREDGLDLSYKLHSPKGGSSVGGAPRVTDPHGVQNILLSLVVIQTKLPLGAVGVGHHGNPDALVPTVAVVHVQVEHHCGQVVQHAVKVFLANASRGVQHNGNIPRYAACCGVNKLIC